MKRKNTLLANLIWSICRISPTMGNLVMDISNDLYEFAMRNNTLKIKGGN